MSMPVRRSKFEIWDEGLRSCRACWIMSITWLLVSFTRLDQISSKIWHIVCQSLAILFCEYLLDTSWRLRRIKATRSFKEWNVLQAEATVINIDVVNLSFEHDQMGCFDYIHTHLNSYTVWKTNINGIIFVDKSNAWHTTCYIRAYLSVRI
jgi:hypothetical protein